MTDKGLNLSDECAAECVHMCPQGYIANTLVTLPEETVACTNLAL